jgi:putative holliday junction resolvase
MGRIISIDYGKKRTGLAVTDPFRIIATPLTTIPTRELEAWLTKYFAANEVDEAVIGYPVTMNNLPSESVRYIEPFINRFRKVFPDIPLHLADERFTSSIAMQAMIDGGLKKSTRRDKSIVDRVSASLILQSWLEKSDV